MDRDDVSSFDAAGALRPSQSVHGQPGPLSIDSLLDEDPDLWLAAANMRAWLEAHPCQCEALCECD
jgi:hypothetical protein